MIVKIIQIHKISVPFNDMIKACQMSELSSSGNAFTWGGKRNNKWIQYKLDRCFGNKDWHLMFPASNQAFWKKEVMIID